MAGGVGSIPGQGTKIPHASRCGHKIERWTIYSKGPDPGRMQVEEDAAWMDGHEHHSLVERGPSSVLDSTQAFFHF